MGLRACSGLATNAEYCADAGCSAAILDVGAAWSQCQDDPALAPLWGELLGICTVQDCSAAAAPSWSAPLLDGIMPTASASGITLTGNTFLDGDLGVAMDGDSDYAMLFGGSFLMDYAADGEFSVGMWFSRSSVCNINSDWEFLWSQSALAEGGTTNSTNLHMSVLCDSTMTNGDGSQVLSQTGTVVTTLMADDAGTFAQFDWSLAREAPKLDAVTSEWTHMVLSVSANSIKVFADGNEVSQYGYHIWSQERVVDNNPANPDPTALRMPLSTFTMNQPVYLGTYEPSANSWWAGANFPGNMAGLAIYDNAVDLTTAACAFQTGSQAVGTCPVPSTMPGAVWFGDFLDGITPPGAAMVGNAALDLEFGITVDGSGDYVTVLGQDYASSGSFSVSFWFTRQGDCNVANGGEWLYSHSASDTLAYQDAANTGVHIMLSCGAGGAGDDMVQVTLVDDSQNRARFETPLLSLGSGGPVVNQWIHLVLVVDTRSAQLYLDGVPTSATPIDPIDRPWAIWRTADCSDPLADRAECNAAFPDPMAMTLPFSGFTLASRDIVIAGQRDQWGGAGRMFFGSMAGVALFSEPLGAIRIRCLNRYDAERVGTCSDPDPVWDSSFMQGQIGNGVQLKGGATLDGKFGLQLDGEGDYVTVTDMPAFSARGRFSISLWFFKASDCDVPEQFEFLFSTVQDGWQDSRTASQVWNPTRWSGIHMFLGCAEGGASSTVDGNVLRTWLIDNQGTRATFDYSLSGARGGGAVTDGWIHATLTVKSTELALYIDGEAADLNYIGYSRGSSRGSGGNWDGTDFDNQNAAYPNIGNLNPPLSGFDNAERYQDFAEYNYTLAIPVGEHQFTAMDDSSDGWHGGYWELFLGGEGTRGYPGWQDTTPSIAGGRVDGQLTSMRATTLVTIPQRPNTIVAFGPDCEGGDSVTDYFDDSAFDSTVTLEAGTTYYMHTGEGGWDGSYWTVMDAAGAVIAGGDATFGCCTTNSEDITPVTVSATMIVTIRITTFHRSGIQWVMDTDSAPMEGRLRDWQRRPCSTYILVKINTHRYASEMNWAMESRPQFDYLQDRACSRRNEICDSRSAPCNTANSRDECEALCLADPTCMSYENNVGEGGDRCQMSTTCQGTYTSNYNGWTIGVKGEPTQWFKGPESATVYLGARQDIGLRADNPSEWTYFLGNMADVKVFGYAVEPDDAKCMFRSGTATIGVCKAVTDMRGLSWYGSFLDNQWPAGATPTGAAYLDGAFGARVTGEDDSVVIDTPDYASSGSFTVAFWMTQTECKIPGQFEDIYSHARYPERDNWWDTDLNDVNSNVHIWASCTDEGGHSSLGGSIVRVWLTDDSGQRGVFDWSFDSAASGGFVVDSWVHMVLTVTSSSVKVYLDGRPLDSISDRMFGMLLPDLTGPEIPIGRSHLDNPIYDIPGSIAYGDGSDLTLDTAVQFCSEFCRSEGYSYFGLQWTSRCECDNSYGSFGEVNATRVDPMTGSSGACDINGDDVPDCGYGQVAANGAPACPNMNAVYSLAGEDPAYMGCFADMVRPTTCGEAPTCEVCALMAGQNCGWNTRRGQCREGSSTDASECSVSEYGYPLTPVWSGDGDWWAWARTEDNVLWPDPTRLRQESCTAPTGTDAADPLIAACAAITLGADTSKANCRAVGSNYIGVADKKNRMDAEVYCMSTFAGNLASIHDTVGQNNARVACADVSPEVQCWIGLNDESVEGNFQWTDNSQTDYFAWAAGEPNDWRANDQTGDPQTGRPGLPTDLDPGGEDGVLMWHRNSSNTCTQCTQAADGEDPQSWNDQSADELYAFVCQTTMVSVPEQPTCVYGPQFSLAGFTMDEVYLPDSDYYVEMDMPSRIYMFTAQSAAGYGWSNGWWEFVVGTKADAMAGAAQRVAGGETAGLVTTATRQGIVQVPACPALGAVCKVTMHIRTGYRASQISWYIDDVTAGIVTEHMYAGPSRGTVGLGKDPSSGGSSRYEGSFAGVALFRGAIDADEADCLYRDGEGSVQVCATAAMLSKERLTAYYGSFTSSTQTTSYYGDVSTQYDGLEGLPDGTSLMGGAYLDRDFGVQLDGEGDYIALEADWRSTGYAQDGTFAISFWFSKSSECAPAWSNAQSDFNSFETLFSHVSDLDREVWDRRNSNVNIQIGCDEDGSMSSASGDIIRVWLTDENRNQGVMDVSLSQARSGGYVTDQWIHMLLMVDHREVQMYLDGRKVGDDGFGYPLDSCGGCHLWAGTSRNLLWPNPNDIDATRFVRNGDDPRDRAFGRFGMYQTYSSNTWYNISVRLSPGDHTMTTMDLGGPTNAWHGGTWALQERTRGLSGSWHEIPRAEVDAGNSEAICATLCTTGGFRFMGLQWNNECFCDNVYDDRPTAPAGDCDVDGDSVPDCGKDVDRACGYRNAVYDAATRTYIGCYMDSEDADGPIAASGLGGESATVSVPYPTGVYGYGPKCDKWMHDFGRFNTSMQLPAGASYIHAGGRSDRSLPDWRHADASTYGCEFSRPTNQDNMLMCHDGVYCTGWRCCESHQGRAQCPQNVPWMCADPTTGGAGNDYSCEFAEADCDNQGGVRQCQGDLSTYWTLYDASTGAVIAGGDPSATCCMDPNAQILDVNADGVNDEAVTAINVAVPTAAIMQITTQSLSGVKWVVNDSPMGIDSGRGGWDECGWGPLHDKNYRLEIRSGDYRAWDMKWMIDDGDRYAGPLRRPLYMGASADLNPDRFIAGSIAEVMLLRYPVPAEDADCIYSYGGTQVGVCIPQGEMNSLAWVGTFLADSEERYANRDMNGALYRTGARNDTARTEAEAVASCKTQCGSDYQYIGLQWSNACWCDNDYGGRGELTNGECNTDSSADGSIDCSQGDTACSGMNAVYDTQDTTGQSWTPVSTVVPNLVTYRAWMASDPNIDATMPCMECYPASLRDGSGQMNGGYDPTQLVFPMYLALDILDDPIHGNADVEAIVQSWMAFQNPGMLFLAWRNGATAGDQRGAALFIDQDGARLRSEDEYAVTGYSTIEITNDAPAAYLGCYADGWDVPGAAFFGDARVSGDFGAHLDGRGDYITIDPLGQQNPDSYNPGVFTTDSKFTISFWFWKRACTVAGGFEWLYSHNDNNEDMYNEPPADAVWTSVPLMIASEQERLDWIASDPDITDALCEECGNAPYFLSLDMDHGHRDVDTHRTVQSYMAWKYPGMVWSAWKPGVSMGEQRGRALFIDGDGAPGGRVRSEQGRAVNGYASILVTNDQMLNSNVNIFLGCTEKGVQSTLDGDIVRTVMVDDEGNRATFDFSLDDARSGGIISDGWVHLAMTVESGTNLYGSIGVYVDAVRLGRDSFGFQPVSDTATWIEIPVSIPSEAMRQFWIMSDDEVQDPSCRECDQNPGLDNTDGRPEQIQFPLYLALDDWGDGDAADATVASYMAAFMPNQPYVSWKRGNLIGAMPGRAVWKSRSYDDNFPNSQRFQSENEYDVNAYSSIFVTTDVSWSVSSRNLAYPDPNRLQGAFGSFTMSQPIYMGVKSDLDCNTYYLGHIAEVALFWDNLDPKEIDCLNRDVASAGIMSVCQTPDQMPSRVFTRDFLDADRTEMSGVTLGGDASVDSERGLVLDGAGDYATISTRAYGSGAFTVSFWVSRTDCSGTYSNILHERKPPINFLNTS